MGLPSANKHLRVWELIHLYSATSHTVLHEEFGGEGHIKGLNINPLAPTTKSRGSGDRRDARQPGEYAGLREEYYFRRLRT